MAWYPNPDWFKAMPKLDVCGRVSDRYTPCPNKKPCPVHDSGSLPEDGALVQASAVGREPKGETSACAPSSESEQLVVHDSSPTGVGGIPPSVSPAPHFFDPWEAK